MKILQGKELKDGHPYNMENGILKRYVSDNKQVFETVVILLSHTRQILEEVHGWLRT